MIVVLLLETVQYLNKGTCKGPTRTLGMTHHPKPFSPSQRRCSSYVSHAKCIQIEDTRFLGRLEIVSALKELQSHA